MLRTRRPRPYKSVILTQGDEQHEIHKESGNALARHLAHRNGAGPVAQPQLLGATADPGDPRDRGRHTDPAR